jgi:Putative prokaryotic signal transducing protein
MPRGDIVHVATAYSVSEAHIIQSMLRSYGIAAELFDLQTVNTDPGLMWAVGGIRVCVAEADAADARQLVWQGQAAEKGKPVSTYHRKGWLNSAIAIILAFMGVASPARIKMHRPED